LPKRERIDFKNFYTQASESALDLLENMLRFNPQKRYSAEECLAHKYFEGLHDINNEKTSPHFDWSFDRFVPKNIQQVRKLIYDEILECNKAL